LKSASRWAALALGLSIVASLALFGVYVGGGNPQAEGVLLFVALGGVGAALMLWSRLLMPEVHDQTQPRHHGPEPEKELEGATETVTRGVVEMRRRGFLFRLLIGAAAALGVAAIIPIRSLGRAPGSSLLHTRWRAGDRLVNEEGTPITRDTLEVDSFTTVFPEHAPGSPDSQAVLIRVEPGALRLPPDRVAGAPDGYVAYSKICTHAGCALGLYLAAVQQLRCPCHQSTFDVLDGARPVYGPAPRPLPQLPIRIEDDGTIRANGDFTDPVGPSFWDLPT
jgi:ubiquinol-cytochrome c reductase iron-sulfur subunit